MNEKQEEQEEYPKELIFNFMLELRKKEIDNLQRARLIQSYLKKTNKSQNALANELGVPKTTLQDWLLWHRLSNDDYKKLKDNGFNDKDIYKKLRTGKEVSTDTIVRSTKVDSALEDAIKLLRPVSKLGKDSSKTYDLMKEIRNLLNVIEMYIDKQRKQ